MLQGRQTIMRVCLLGEVFDFHQHAVYMCIAMYITCMAFVGFLCVFVCNQRNVGLLL